MRAQSFGHGGITVSGLDTKPVTGLEARPIRVAHFYSTLGMYGAERWALAVMKYLDDQRFPAMIVTVGTKPGARLLHDFAVREGHDAVHIDVPGKVNPRAVLQLRRLLLERRIDILHTHGFKSDTLGYLATRGLAVRLVATLHGWSMTESARIRLYEAFGRVILRRFDRIYPLSTALLADMQQRGFGASRMRLIRNAVDIAPLDQYFQNRRVRSHGEPFRILFAGRLCKPKGVNFLIQAMAKARFDSVARLTVAGDGPDRGKLEQLADDLAVRDRVTFVGVARQIGPLIADHDVLVLPSFCQGARCEGVPRIVMEAFSAGTPVIGSSVPGICELIEHERTGLLVPIGDDEALARALERIERQPDFAQGVALNARERVETVFSATRLARELEAEYEALARPAGSVTPVAHTVAVAELSSRPRARSPEPSGALPGVNPAHAHTNR